MVCEVKNIKIEIQNQVLTILDFKFRRDMKKDNKRGGNVIYI